MTFKELCEEAGYESFSLPEKLAYVLEIKHRSLSDGCDAHVELYNVLLPQAMKELAIARERLGPAGYKLLLELNAAREFVNAAKRSDRLELLPQALEAYDRVCEGK